MRSKASTAYKFDGFILHLERGALLANGVERALRHKYFALLHHFVENPGRLVDRDEIVQAVWAGIAVSDGSIAQCVMDIRRALGDDAQQLLRTVPRRGYLFTAQVRQEAGQRRAMALSLDRKGFIDIIGEGQGDIGGVLQPAPGGLWGTPPELLKNLPGYDPDVQKNRAQARRIMEKLGYGPDNRLAIKVSTRDLPIYRDSAVILIDQLKEVYFDGELELVDTTRYFPKIMRKDFTVGLNLQASGPDPDPTLEALYGCGSSVNWDGYCNPEVDKLIERQSSEADEGRRKQLVWEIERKLAEDGARPIIFYSRRGTCWHPDVKGLTIMVNSIFNGWRMEDVWLDR